MKLAVFSPSYPGPGRTRSNVFVHVRVKKYIELGHEVRVYTYGKINQSYTWEGVAVWEGTWEYLSEQISSHAFDRFLVHLIDRRVASYIIKNRHYGRVVIWFHGFDFMQWYRDAVRWEWSWNFLKRRMFRIIHNTIELITLRVLLYKAGNKIPFIFVSKWSRQIAKSDLQFGFKQSSIISNPIDTDTFYFATKPPEQRLRVFFMRCYDDYNYAADIAIQSILGFSKHPYFSKFEFLVSGEGERFDEFTTQLMSFPNVKVQSRFMAHTEVARLNAGYGVFLSPSRSDTQGVSMCEAMSSGMVVISSWSSAIPEFVHHDKTGILTHSAQDIIQAYIRLYENPDLFLKLSDASAAWIRDHLSTAQLVPRELDVFEPRPLKIAVFTPTYPNPTRTRSNVFVKVRVDEYVKQGYKIEVFTYGAENSHYFNDGVSVHEGNWDYLSKRLDEYTFDRFLVHLLDRRVAMWIVGHGCYEKCLLWVHGFEALGWYRDAVRWKFEWSFLLGRVRRAANNLVELSVFRYLILRSGHKIRYIFVSYWMRKMAQMDLLFPFSKYKIIPNPINTEIFSYKPKPAEQRFKVFFMRAYDDYKYAADIAIESIHLFSKHPDFDRFEFLVTGEGSRFEELTSGLKKFTNVIVQKRFMNHSEISELNSQYGVFLSPSRQDAQGVSMCEAMSSGMVVISSFSTAIPEFVHHMKTGILTWSAQEIVQAYIQLSNDPVLFERLSSAAAQWVKLNLKIDDIIQRELVEITQN